MIWVRVMVMVRVRVRVGVRVRGSYQLLAGPCLQHRLAVLPDELLQG